MKLRGRTGRVGVALPAAALATFSLLLAAGAPSHALVAAPSTSLPPLSSAPSLDATALDQRLRQIVALVDETRSRAGKPGLRDEERDALAELAWAQIDEALDDPLLRERARRDPDFLQAQALLLMDDGESEDAQEVLQRLQTIAPEDPETHRLLALNLMDLDRAQDAVGEYRRAQALSKGPDADLRARLAYALASAGRREEALAECGRAIAEDPKAYLGHYVRGWILGEAGRPDEARQEYLAAVQRERDDADLWAQLAKSWEAAGEGERAREAWREVLRIDPSDEHAAAKVGEKAGP